MNILLMANHFDTGGITSYLLNLSKGLAAQGHRVWVVSGGGNCTGLLHEYGVTHVQMDIRVKGEAHPKVWFAVPRVAGLIRDKRIDVMHAQTRVTQVIAGVVSVLTKVPYVSTCHGFFRPHVFRRIFQFWGKGTIAISNAVRDHLLRDFHLDPARVTLISNGIDVESFKSAQSKQPARAQWQVQGNPIVGIIARLSSVKGIDVLINATLKIKTIFPDVRLWIIGEGPEQTTLQRLVSEQGLKDTVVFKPIVNRTRDILPIMDVFVMPSLQEGLGMSVMEAQAAGIPVVASNVGGLPDLITQGTTGMLVAPGNSAALADAVIEMLQNPGKASRMAQAAQQHVESKFALKTMADKTISFYEQNTRR